MHDAGGWRSNYVMPTQADTYVAAYRRWFDAAGPPPYASAALDHFRRMPLDKKDLLDRYRQHTAYPRSGSNPASSLDVTEPGGSRWPVPAP